MNRPTVSCGACTLCCTLLRVAMDPPKPERAPCAHCTGAGCGIYDKRPEPCEGFQCLWLGSQRIPEMALPSSMRPDRTGIVLDLNGVGTLIAHCSRPASWKREPMRSWLIFYAVRTNVILELPTGAEILAPDGTTECLVRVGVDPVSNNRLYVRAAAFQSIAAE